MIGGEAGDLYGGVAADGGDVHGMLGTGLVQILTARCRLYRTSLLCRVSSCISAGRDDRSG